MTNLMDGNGGRATGGKQVGGEPSGNDMGAPVGRDDQSVVSRGSAEAQGEGGGPEAQMEQRDRGGLASAETLRDAKS